MHEILDTHDTHIFCLRMKSCLRKIHGLRVIRTSKYVRRIRVDGSDTHDTHQTLDTHDTHIFCLRRKYCLRKIHYLRVIRT